MKDEDLKKFADIAHSVSGLSKIHLAEVDDLEAEIKALKAEVDTLKTELNRWDAWYHSKHLRKAQDTKDA